MEPISESKPDKAPLQLCWDPVGLWVSSSTGMSPQPPGEDTAPDPLQMGCKLKTTQRQEISFQLKNKLLY